MGEQTAIDCQLLHSAEIRQLADDPARNGASDDG